MRSPRVLVPILAALVLVGVLVVLTRDSSTTTAPAATVNGFKISQRDVIGELDALAGNDAYIRSVEQAGDIKVRGSEAGSYDPDFVARVLQRRIVRQLIAAEVGRLGLEADDECRLAARNGTIADVGQGTPSVGQPIFDAFPKAYQDQLVQWNLDELLLTAHLASQECVVPDAAKVYYEAHPAEFEEACLSVIQVATQADADRVVAAVRAGADFATTARNESTEPTTAVNGGDLGCKPKNQVPTEFLTAAFATQVGQVSDPVASSGGFAIIKVNDRRQLPLEQVREQARELAAVTAINALDQFLRQATASARIEIDAQYGTWNAQTGAVDPPAPSATSAAGSSGVPISVPVGGADVTAATVGDVVITEADLNAELNAIGRNVAYVDDTHASLVERGSGVRSADGGFDPAFVRTILGRRITFVMVTAEVVRRGVDVGPCRTVAEQRLAGQLASGDAAKGAGLLAGFDRSYRDQLVEWNANLLALQASLVGTTCDTSPNQQQTGPAYASWLDDSLAAVPVTVAPAYGKWDQPSGTVVP